MPRFLVVDFGTTSTKSALVDLDTGVFSHLRRRPALPATAARPGRHEVSLEAIRRRFDEVCADAWGAASGAGFSGIALCSEMHGFALLSADARSPLTPYMSWLDARALEPVAGAASTYDLVRQRLGDDFRRLTGMRPRPGFPLLNLIHCARSQSLPARALVVSLPGWLALAAGATGAPVEHPTILAGMAFYDVAAQRLGPELLDLAGQLGGLRPVLGEPAPEGTVAGHWHSPEGPVPLYVGVGDHQCSVLGAGVTGPGVATVNLGTGSQVAVVDPAPDPALFEHRPYFDGLSLAAVTHIPAGRALDEMIGFLQRVAALGASLAAPPAAPPAADFWRALADLTPGDLESASLDIDLALFEGARNFRGGGRIGGILEGSLTPRNYLASVLAAFTRQYAEVLDLFDPARRLERVLLGGGIARNLPHLAAILAEVSGRKQVEPAAPLDESLLGLRALALRCAGRAPTTAQAQQLHGRDCDVVPGV